MNASVLPPSLRALVVDLPPQAAATFAVRVIAIVAEFACLLLLARILGARVYGDYALAMSLVAIAVVPAMVGFDRLLIREVAAARAISNWELLKGLLVDAFRITLVASAAIAAILLLVATRSTLVRPELREPLALAALLVPILAFVRVRQATLQGLGHVARGLAPESILQPLVLAALAAVVWIAGGAQRTAEVALFLQLCAASSALVAALLLLRPQMPVQLAARRARRRSRQWLESGGVFMWLVGASAALVNVDTVLVGALLGPSNAGAYRVASQLAMLVGFPLAAVSMAMAPAIAEMHATGRHVELRDRAGRAARVILAASTLIAAIIVAIGRPLMAALGSGFEVGYPATLVLVASYLFHASMATSTYLLFMTAHERLAAAVFTAGVAAHVAGNLLLAPRFGLTGAAIASGASLVLVSAASAWLAWRKTGVNATIFAAIGEPARP